MISELTQAKKDITSLLDRWADSYIAKDLAGLRIIWDESYNDLVYQGEEFPGPFTSWKQIKHYYRELLAKLVEKVNRWDRTGLWIDVFHDVAYAFTTTDFSLIVKGIPEPYSGTARQTFIFRKVDEGWKVIHYHESLQSMATPEGLLLDEPDHN